LGARRKGYHRRFVERCIADRSMRRHAARSSGVAPVKNTARQLCGDSRMNMVCSPRLVPEGSRVCSSGSRRMKRRRFTEEQIIGVLKEAEAGAKTKDLCRKYGISDATFYNWKAKYGGMTVSDVRRLRELEQENARLKKLLAEAELDKAALKDLLNRKW